LVDFWVCVHHLHCTKLHFIQNSHIHETTWGAI
jgi:hypothetical protein